jgi:ubiquitin-activating enzyme E1
MYFVPCAAKNLILAGPRSVTLWDPSPVTSFDLGRNYYFTPASIGTTKAEAAVGQLSELNPYVKVSVLRAASLTKEIISEFSVVVATDMPRKEALEVNSICRSASPAIGFIAADVRGVAGYTFVDFGDSHIVRDPNGEANKNAIITSVTRGNPATVYTIDTKRHGFTEGDHVVFREVGGMKELNDSKPRKVLSVKPFSFTIEEDTTSFEDHTSGGLVEQVKVPVPVSYASLAERIVSPIPSDDPMGALITPDFGKFGRPDQLHIAFHAVELYREKHGSLPALRNKEHADEVVAIAKEFLATVTGVRLLCCVRPCCAFSCSYLVWCRNLGPCKPTP